MRRKKRRPGWDDDWRDWFNMDDIDEEFERMHKYMDKLFERVVKGEFDIEKVRPFVYGFSMRMGPNGKPRIQTFGDTRGLPSITAPGKPTLEREPLTDVIESDKTISITVEIPGVNKKDIHLNCLEDSVIISVDTEKRKYYKEIPLPSKVKPDSAKATYNNGVLDITLEKIIIVEKEKKGKRIHIE